jgi:hypothetical protein|tara:strand:+ start:123 stop:497 length:375 start_codon:yes stop_codon:yes gene_type:complete
MLLNQLMFFGILSLFIYVLILLRRTYRKIATTVLVLLLAILVISLAGTIKFSIFDSMNLDLNPSIMDLDDNRELVGGGESILDKLKLWNKILRGKKPIYTTNSGTQIKVNPIGDEKSINLIKPF